MFEDVLRIQRRRILENSNLKISDFVNAEQKAKELGLEIPNSITILPQNFEFAKSKDELIYESTAATVRKLWQYNNIPETRLEKPQDKIPFSAHEAFEWVAPIIFVSAALISENPALVTLALNVISIYLTDWFKGIPQDKQRVRLSIVLENKNKCYKKIEYNGSTEGLRELPEIIEKTYDEN